MLPTRQAKAIELRRETGVVRDPERGNPDAQSCIDRYRIFLHYPDVKQAIEMVSPCNSNPDGSPHRTTERELQGAIERHPAAEVLYTQKEVR